MEGRLDREGSGGLSEEGLDSQTSLGDGSVGKRVGGAECWGRKQNMLTGAVLLSDRWQLCRTSES